ncbi:MAG TPA: serine/threonine-protein kinase [Polyangiales bacterium]|nr:serine/threonine-protein kinase [Polyangiales bacterium]
MASLLRKAARVSEELLPLPRLGQIVGDKYRIDSLLGRGGMGAVFRATHLVSQKPVALKWMLASGSDDRARLRFLREARMSARINHPNVVDVYDVGEQDGCWYLVMELLHGEPLRSRIKAGPLSVDEALDLLVPAMHGVAAVHRAGVVHRDLKPDNIFLCKGSDGAPREAKVLDFGISAATELALDIPTLTEEGALLGTPAYMSPEQLQNARDIDARADVYSFGVILYEALTGRLPFTATTYAALVLAVIHQQPRPLAEACPGISDALSRIVLRALAKSPEDRYSSIGGLIQAIMPFSRGASIPIPTLALPRRTYLPAIAAGAIVAAVLAAWLHPRAGVDREETSQSAAQPRDLRFSASADMPTWFEPASRWSEPFRPAAEPAPMCRVSERSEAAVTTSAPPPPARPIASVRGPRVSGLSRPTQPMPVQPREPEPKNKAAAGHECEPPYSVDGLGHIRFKVECL